MTDGDDQVASRPLQRALSEFQDFLRSDDLERIEAIGNADSERLAVFTAAVEALHGEINQVLDGLVERPHPLPEDLEQLEVDLNSLAQAAMEAELELTSRQERYVGSWRSRGILLPAAYQNGPLIEESAVASLAWGVVDVSEPNRPDVGHGPVAIWAPGSQWPKGPTNQDAGS